MGAHSRASAVADDESVRESLTDTKVLWTFAGTARILWIPRS
jgi:hypothetical protein